MSVGDRDPHTGHMTTGHNWNGITELNSPVPKIVWIALSLTIAFSIVYWVLMPAWPTGSSFTEGTLGVDQRTDVADALAFGAKQREPWQRKLAQMPVAAIAQNPELSAVAAQGGAQLFGDNCAVCHGAIGDGGPGYPVLNDTSWLWGNDPEQIMKTLRVGINSTHPNTRVSQMPAFATIDQTQLSALIAYVRSLSGINEHIRSDQRAQQLDAGSQTFGAMCAACHGADATGNAALGAPNLTDAAWIYGADKRSVAKTIRAGRAGVMPSWEERLNAVERKMLVLYLLELSSNTEPTDKSEATQ